MYMLNPSQLRSFLQQFPNTQRFLIAYSGGLDSHVLLHALANILPKEKLKAVYINHGWHKDAEQWGEHCQQVCQDLNISCEVVKVDAQPKQGESAEECAREARYAAFANLVQTNDCLLTAHQQNDQAETLLLQMFRGAGIKGLASMPVITSFALGYHARPLLNYARTDLEAYAKQHHLKWIEDDSNKNLRFDRNFIRHQILPEIQQHWPQVTKTIARVAEHCAEAELLLEQLAQQDLAIVGAQHAAPVLSISKLLNLNPARLHNVLRYWLRQLGFAVPSQMQLQHIETDVLQCNADANPVVAWGEVEVRRYRDDLYALPKHKIENLPEQLIWNLAQPLAIPEMGTLVATQELGKGICCVALPENKVTIRFRQNGERFHPAGRQGSHPLKKLMQEWNIPPWQRDFIPLIYHDNQLIAVAGFAVHAEFVAKSDEMGWEIKLV